MAKAGITLNFNENTGEGSIKLRSAFTDNNVLLQIDCLQDWIGELTHFYNKGLEDFRNHGSFTRNLFKEVT